MCCFCGATVESQRFEGTADRHLGLMEFFLKDATRGGLKKNAGHFVGGSLDRWMKWLERLF